MNDDLSGFQKLEPGVNALNREIDQTGKDHSAIDIADDEVKSLRVDFKGILHIKNLEHYTVCFPWTY